MYYESEYQPAGRAQRASEIEMRVREQEKKMSLMHALYHHEAAVQPQHTLAKSRNPFRALLGIFLAGF